MGSSCLPQQPDLPEAAEQLPGNVIRYPIIHHTDDLAWLLTFEINDAGGDVILIQTLLSPRDPRINPEAGEPDFEQAERVCREWSERTNSSDAKILLAAIRYERGNSAAALISLTEVIARNPSDWKALWIRSQVLQSVGQFEAARDDARRMADVLPTDVFEKEFPEVESTTRAFSVFDAEFDLSGDPDLLIPLVAIHFVVYFILAIRCGRRQKREAGGTWRRLIAVALAIASLWTLPVLAAAVLISASIGSPPGPIWWILMEIFALLLVRSMMNPPNYSYVGKDPLPPCDDPEMLARVDALSKSIGVKTPTVRSQRALNSTTDSAAAFVGGLAPHSVVLYDTVLAQLKEDEQDAVIGHELGHIANWSIWVYTTVYPLTAVGIVVLSFLFGGYLGTIAGMALYVGTFRILSRRFEYDCDRRSAIATSPDAMARGLRRIYARHPLGKPGLLTSIVHSMASHPSLDERIHALSKMAGSGQSVSVAFSDERVRLCGKLVGFFAIAWLALTAFGITGQLLAVAAPFPAIVIHMATFGPMAFTLIAMRRPARILALRNKGKFRWKKLRLRQQLALISILLLAILAGLSALTPDLLFPDPRQAPLTGVLWAAVIILLIGMVLLGGLTKPKPRRYQKLIIEMTGAFQRNDFQKVLDLCEENRKDVDEDKFLRQNEAAALLGTGEFDRCVECFESLVEDEPWFPPAITALAAILIDQGNPQRSLDLIRSVEKDLHKLDPMPPLVAARALRELGRHEKAQDECDRAAKLAPDDVSVMGFSASLALQRGDREEADRILDLANSLLPAEPLVIVARAERAILDNDIETLRIEHEALAASLEDDRLLNLHSFVARLKAALPADELTDVKDDSAANDSPETPPD